MSECQEEEVKELLSTLASTAQDEHDLHSDTDGHTLHKVHQTFLFPGNNNDDNDDDDDDDDNDDDVIISIVSNQDLMAKVCSQDLPPLKSKHAKQRITNLIARVILQRINHDVNVSGNVNVSGDINTVQLLIDALCGILVKAKIGLLDKTIAVLNILQRHNDNDNDDNDDNDDDEDDDDDSDDNTDNDDNANDADLDVDVDVDDDNKSNVQSLVQKAFQSHVNANNHHWPVALSIIASLHHHQTDVDADVDAEANANANANANMQIFLQETLQSNKFPSTPTITLAQHYISSSQLIHPSQFATMAPVLGLKLRANPETSLETITAIVSFLPNSIDFSKDLIDIDHDNVNVNDSTSASAKVLPAVMKQLAHSKAPMRSLASSLIGKLGLFQGCFGIVANHLAASLGKKAGSTSTTSSLVNLTTAEHRIGVYAALGSIAKAHLSTCGGGGGGGGDEGEEMEHGDSDVAMTVNAVLEAMATSMTKEMGKAKECGLDSLIQWMALSKQDAFKNKDDSTADGTGNGYAKAMEYFIQPILDVKPGSAAIGSEFRFRLGALFTLDARDSDSYPIAESFAINLWKHGNGSTRKEEQKIKAGLQAVVDAAVKKSKNSNLVAQVDGLIAIQLLLILAKLKKNKEDTVLTVLPSSVLKVLQDGGVAVTGTARTAKSSSFLYSQPMMDAFSTEPIVQQLLHRVIALYTKLIAKARDKNDAPASSSKSEYVGIVKSNQDGFSAASLALASCIVQKASASNDHDAIAIAIANAVEASVKTVITYSIPVERATDAIISATYIRANELCLETNTNTNSDDPFQNVNSASIRSVAAHIAKVTTDVKHWTDALILSHLGTSASVIMPDEEDGDSEEMQMREELEDSCTKILLATKKHISESDFEGVADRIIDSAACHSLNGNGEEESVLISEAIHLSTLSLVATFGKIAGTYDEELTDAEEEESKVCIFAWKVCVKELAGKLSSHLDSIVKKVEELTVEDVGLYTSPEGQLYGAGKKSQKDADSTTNKGKRLSEEEEWENQVRRELAEKKKKNQSGVPSLSAEDKSKIAEQTVARNGIKYILDWDYMRTLAMVQALCSSDIEVGNAILSTVSPAVVSAAISTSQALKLESMSEESKKTLCKLAECVYEIDEENAEALARALILCQKKCSKGESKEPIVVALPAKCEDAAIVISEMDDYGDTLSGNSFAFLFPVVRAALTGQRTTPGCEAALQVLDRHTDLISTDSTVTSLRKEMSSSILELLSHDRSIAFKDPSPTEALINIYTKGNKPTATELAPLLSESGALGGKNCRLAAMTAFAAIIDEYPKIAKTNPVMENRILVNCFAKDDSINSEARRAWKLAHGKSEEESDLPAPSKIYAIALVPLLSHKDSDIANAAAAAFAFGIERHPGLAEKSFNRLFNAYIDTYATTSSEGVAQPAIPAPSTSVAKTPATLQSKPKKKAPKLDIGTVKKKGLKKKTGGSVMSSLTKTKGTTKKKTTKSSSIAAFAPKKKERSIDRDALNAQFAPTASAAQKAEEKDSEEKISNRTGVLRVLSAVSSSSSALELETPMLKLLVGFLMAYGLADVNEKLRTSASGALRDVVASDSSKSAMDFILPALESTLKDGKVDKSFLGDLPTEKVLDNTAATDHRKEGVVIALGSAAIHLRNVEDAEKISETFNMLIAALSTPSETVQASVALCLSKLMKKGDMKAKTESLLEDQINGCLHGTSLASRRGAAYGISAIVKGSGIAALKKFSVVKQLEEACTSGSATTKEGALFAIELLSERLGLLFEPYVIVLLPALLKSFSDPSDHVRSAARNSVGLVMSKLSGHGVKLLVPAVLSGLEEDDWRTKQASIHMLGSMSQCAPKQLAR